MNKYLFAILCACVTCGALVSCVKSPTSPAAPQPPALSSHGVFVMNEGIYQTTSSTLDFLNLNTGVYYNDILLVSASLLSDGTDLVQANGDSLYAVMSNSNRIYLISDSAGGALKILAEDSSASFMQPYNMALLNDSVAAITEFNSNTVTIYNLRAHTAIKDVTVGSNPEGLAYANGKLYVAAPGLNYSNRLDIVDPASGRDAYLAINTNPTYVRAAGDSLVLVLCSGDTSAAGTALYFINTASDTIAARVPLGSYPSKFALDGDRCYVIESSSVVRVDLTTRTIRDTLVANHSFYGIAVDTTTHNVFLSDAKDYQSQGTLFEYDPSGNVLETYTTGVNPGTLLVKYK